MADAFYGEIRMFPFGYTPIGWLPCNGQKVSINSNPALYSLLGIKFGGDGKTYFNLPNLNGSIPLNFGTAKTGTVYALAKTLGQETVQLMPSQAPAHSHDFNVKNSSAAATGMTGQATTTGTPPTGTSLMSRALNSAAKVINAFDIPPSNNMVPLGTMVSPAYGNNLGRADPHPNLQPYLVMAYYICANGIYPERPD